MPTPSESLGGESERPVVESSGTPSDINWESFDWDPLPTPTIHAGRGGHRGVTLRGISSALGCTDAVIKTLGIQPIDFAFVFPNREFPIFFEGLVDQFRSHPSVVAGAERRARKLTPARRQRALSLLVAHWDWPQQALIGLVVENHRSVERVAIELSPMTVLIGPNGGGKTSILEAIGAGNRARRLGRNASEADEALVRLRPGAPPARKSQCWGVHRLPQVPDTMIDTFLDTFLRGVAASAVTGLRSLLRNSLLHPVVLHGGTKTWLALPEAEIEMALLAAEVRSSTKLRDEWLDGFLVGVEDGVSLFPALVPLPAGDLPGTPVEVFDADPDGLVTDLEARLPALADAIWPRSSAPKRTIKVDGGEELIVAPWIRWLKAPGNLSGDEILEMWSAHDPELVVGNPSGRANWLAYGTGHIRPENVRAVFRAGGRPPSSVVDDVFARVEHSTRSVESLDDDDPEWRRVVGLLRTADPGFFRKTAEVSDRFEDGWLQGDGWRAEVPVALLALCVLLEREANRLAPRFVQEFGWISLQPRTPNTWAVNGSRLGVEFITRDGIPRQLAEVGHGIQRWSAASLREALRRLEQSPIESGELTYDAPQTIDQVVAQTYIGDIGLRDSLLVVDEPELALHPFAQEQAAEWLANVSDGGQRVVVATHSPAFLDLPSSQVGVWTVSLGETTEVRNIRSSTFDGLAELAATLGLGRAGVLHLARGFVVVEGPTDRMVMERLVGRELQRQRLVVIPLHGHTKVLSLVQPEFLQAVGKPISVLLDSVREEVLRGERAPASPEEKSVKKIQEARLNGFDIEVVSFDAPDIFCALPDAAVRRIIPGFAGWAILLESWRAAGHGGSFKNFALDTINWSRERSFEFAAAVLDSTTDRDEATPWFSRSVRSLFSWADALGVLPSPAPPVR